MCDPMTLIGLALTAGSTAMNSMAAGKVAGARKGVLGAERTRQAGYDAENDTLNTQSQDRYTNFGDKQAATAGTLADYYSGQTVAPQSPDLIPTSTSAIVQQDEAAKRGDARDYTTQQGEALAKLRAFGDLLGENSLGQARDAGAIGQINGFKRGSSDVTAYELDAANHQGDGLKTFADLLGGVGSIATGAGLGGTSAAATKAGTAGLSLVPYAGTAAKVAPKSLFGGFF